MTQREFLNKVIEANVNDELTAYATSALDKLNERNAKRKTSMTPSQKANAEIMPKITDFVREQEGAVLASTVAEHFDFSTQKASGLLNLLVKDGTLTATEVKVPKKGKRKAYTVTTANTEDAEDTED